MSYTSCVTTCGATSRSEQNFQNRDSPLASGLADGSASRADHAGSSTAFERAGITNGSSRDSARPTRLLTFVHRLSDIPEAAGKALLISVRNLGGCAGRRCGSDFGTRANVRMAEIISLWVISSRVGWASSSPIR